MRYDGGSAGARPERFNETYMKTEMRIENNVAHREGSGLDDAGRGTCSSVERALRERDDGECLGDDGTRVRSGKPSSHPHRLLSIAVRFVAVHIDLHEDGGLRAAI